MSYKKKVVFKDKKAILELPPNVYQINDIKIKDIPNIEGK